MSDKAPPPFDERFDDVNDEEGLHQRLEEVQAWFDREHETGELLVSRDGERGGPKNFPLRFVRICATDNTKVKLLLLPGWSESYLKYAELLYELHESLGCEILAYDHRSQGFSGRLLANQQISWIADFDDYVTDMLAFVDEVVFPDHERDSMGGLVALRAAMRRPGLIDRLVTTSPCLSLDPLQVHRKLPSWVLRVVGEVACIVGLSRSYPPGRQDVDVTQDVKGWRMERGANNRVSQSWARASHWERHGRKLHPSTILAGPSWGWLAACYAARLDEHTLTKDQMVAVLQLPILIISAGQEKLVDNKAIDYFAAMAPSCHHMVVKGAKHELHMELEEFRSQVVGKTREFFQAPRVEELMNHWGPGDTPKVATSPPSASRRAAVVVARWVFALIAVFVVWRARL